MLALRPHATAAAALIVVLSLCHGCLNQASDSTDGGDNVDASAQEAGAADVGQADVADAGSDQLCPGDSDCDGDPDDTDCEPDNPDVFRQQAETCNGVDDNCVDGTDEEGAEGCTTYYLDQDGDKHGDGAKTKCLCARGSGYDATEGDDCYDEQYDARPGQQAWYTDHRGDGSFDYDCDKVESRRYPLVGDCIWDATNKTCKHVTGFADSAPACGDAGQWIEACVAQASSTCLPTLSKRQQECH